MPDNRFAQSPNDSGEFASTRPARQGSHFAVPVSDELNALMDELEGPVSAQPSMPEPEDELEAIAQAYVGSTSTYAQEPRYGASSLDDDIPAYSAQPSPFTPNPSMPPLQGAVPLAMPTVEYSGKPGDTIPQPLEDLSDRINTEGPVLRTQDVYVVPEAPSEPQPDALGASGPFEPVKIQTASSQEETGAPRPINVDPASTGAFHTLSAGEGAVMTTRDTASSAKDAALTSLSEGEHSRRSGHLREATSHQVASSQNARAKRSVEPNRKLIVAIVAIAVLLGAAGFFFATQVMSGAGKGPGSGGAVASSVVTVGESVDFGSYSYTLQQDQAGTWSIVRIPEGASSGSAITSVQGTPVALVLSEGALYVPLNHEGTWDVVALMIADGSEPTQLMTPDGKVFGGQGAAESVTISGSDLTVTDTNGQKLSVNLKA